jgi:NADPH:quinone reductase-like Zn-dependent oxidoreductase
LDYTVNAVDPLQRDLGLFVAQFPTVGGYDGAGVVEKVGANVTKFEVGDRMYVSLPICVEMVQSVYLSIL